MIYKFVPHKVAPLDNYSKCTYYILHDRISRGEPMTEEEKLDLVFTHYEPVKKLMGWAYDYREFLIEFWVEFEDEGDIRKYWAFDKVVLEKYIRINEEAENIRIVEIGRMK